MKKIIVASLGLALLSALPVSAAGQMTTEELIKWATDHGTCGTKSVLDAKYLADGRVQVTCGIPASGGTGGALTGGLGGSGATVAAVLGVVIVAVAAGGSSSTNTTN
jgi:hypothetical protein